jgi:hypothetical protein
MFRFGDGAESRSVRKVTIPTKIGSKKYQSKVDVVKNDIPLLISKPVMKKLGLSGSDLDLKNDLWKVDDEKIKLQCTSSGHYCTCHHCLHKRKHSGAHNNDLTMYIGV